MRPPLSSLKILDFSTLLPGPFASMHLADMGAEVLRVEAPNRPDLMRLTPPFAPPPYEQHSAWHSLLNRSKRSIALDLKQAAAVEVVKRLVQHYDIVLEQFRPGVMDRLGIGYATLCEVNPRLIYCAISSYGQDGPYRERAAHDINSLALAGVLSHTGSKAHGPSPLGVQVADMGSSFLAINGILAAVIQRMETGQGQFVDISMFDTALAWNAVAAAQGLLGNEDPDYESWLLNGGSYYGCYRTLDGRYLSVGSLEPKFWQGFCQAIERPDLIAQGFDQTPATQQALKEQIQSTIATRTLDEWVAIFAPLDLCVEPVLTVSEAIAHPQMQARGMVVEVAYPDSLLPSTSSGNGESEYGYSSNPMAVISSQSKQQQIGAPIKFSSSQPVYKHTGVALGRDTDVVLREIGYHEDEIAQMRRLGVFGKK